MQDECLVPPPDAGRTHGDFRLLLTAQTISAAGTQITVVVLPAVAVLAFGSGIGAATLLLVAEFLPAALIGPFGGVLVDRFRLRTVLVCLDVIRMLVLLAAAAAIAGGARSMALLYAVAGVLGAAGAVFDAGAETAVPGLVAPGLLARANAVRAGTLNVVRVVGPGLGGLLVAVSPVAGLLVDAATFAVSGAVLAVTRSATMRSRKPVGREGGTSVTAQLAVGVRLVRGDVVLRRSVWGMATMNVAGSGIGALFFVYVYRDLGLGPREVGVIMAAFSLGAVAGGAASARLSRRWGAGLACALCATTAATALFAIPAASLGRPVAVLIAYQLTFGAAATAWATILLVLRQRRTAPQVLGRVSALVNAVAIATVPVGAVVGTVLAAVVGLRWTMLALASVAAVTPSFYWRRDFRTLPDAAVAPPGRAGPADSWSG